MHFLPHALKVVFWAAFGGAVAGFHIALLAMGEFAAWIFFNLIVGFFLVYVATLFSRELIFREPKEPYSHRGEQSRENEEER